jgi:protein-disulfide isomerase
VQTIPHSGGTRWRSALEIATIALMIIVTIWLVMTVPKARGRIVLGEPAPPAEAIGLDGAATMGLPTAPVAIILYSDFLCPACGKFARETLPTIQREYIQTGKVLLAFRHFPIGDVPRLGFKAAEAATCAGRQGKFWEFHDRLFGNQASSGPEELMRLARDLVLEPEAYLKCLRGEAAKEVHLDAGGGLALGVNATPTLLIGPLQPDGLVKAVRQVNGAVPPKVLSEMLEALLANNPS